MESNYKNNMNDNQIFEVKQEKKVNLLDALICGYFSVLMVLCFIYGFIESYYDASSCEAGGCSGFFIFGVLITTVFLGFPATIGSIISAINIFARKKVLTIFEIALLMLNIRLMLSDLFSNAHYILLKYAIIILTIILVIICLFSLFENDKKIKSK